jgi:phenylacetate-CoA ligase
MTGRPGGALTEDERRPLIDSEGRRLLDRLLEDPRAPRYNHICGDRLTRAGLSAVRALETATLTASTVPGRLPAWLAPFAARCTRTVPIYRRSGPPAGRLADLPTVARDDLAREPWAFVPDDHPLDDMVVYTSTGTNDGRGVHVASTPEAASGYLVMLRAALGLYGLTLEGGPGRTAVALVCWQQHTYTYVSVSSYLDQAAIVKLNLNPADWADPSGVAAYLDDMRPEVFTGDPVAFSHLAELPVQHHPKALLSTAMALTGALRDRLQDRFGCPVIDVYGMNEAGPVAAMAPDGSGHMVLQPQLHVEILNGAGQPSGGGERGEIALTGGFNSALPLLRYRTGDFARLEHRGGRQLLVGLEGRDPVPFVGQDGRAVSTIDVTRAMHAFPLARFSVHQRRDHGLLIGVEGLSDLDNAAIVAALSELFGLLPMEVHSMAGAPEKRAYSTDLGADSGRRE